MQHFDENATGVPAWERQLALLMALLRTLVCAYRAATQSVVHDEAYSYNTFLNGSWSVPFRRYDAANHILFSFLSKASITLFGLSELTLRLPTLIAGFFLMWGIFRILERTNSRALRWSMFFALWLHPLLFDFSVAARGYGLALTLLVWAMEYSLRRRFHIAGILIGLSLSANLSMGIPAFALIASLALIGEDSWLRRASDLWPLAAWPAAVVAAICGEALRTASLSNFDHAGLPTFAWSLRNTIEMSVYKSGSRGPFGTTWWVHFFQFVAIPMAAACVGVVSIRIWRNGTGLRIKLIPAMTLGIAVLAIVSAHLLVRLPYPIDRTGLYLPVLAGLAWCLVSGEVSARWFRIANVVLIGAMGWQFATQFDTQVMAPWPYDRRIREVARRIAEESKGKLPASVSIGATWLNQPALEFYRQRFRIAALRPVERFLHPPLSGQDYYVLSGPDKDEPAAKRLTVLLSDEYGYGEMVFAK